MGKVSKGKRRRETGQEEETSKKVEMACHSSSRGRTAREREEMNKEEGNGGQKRNQDLATIYEGWEKDKGKRRKKQTRKKKQTNRNKALTLYVGIDRKDSKGKRRWKKRRKERKANRNKSLPSYVGSDRKDSKGKRGKEQGRRKRRAKKEPGTDNHI
jgi:hypothetical protein